MPTKCSEFFYFCKNYFNYSIINFFFYNSLYFLSNVQVYKLVYKFLEIGRMDVILVHLNSLVIKQAESLSVRELERLSDLLLYCYVYRIANTDQTTKGMEDKRNDLLIEFHQFLDNCQSYNHQNGVKKLLELGMIEDMFRVWHTEGCKIVPCIKILSDGDYVDLSVPIIESLLPLLKKNQEFSQQQHVLFHSPFFRSISVDSQIRIILQENLYIKRNIRWIKDSVDLFSDDILIELVSVFDPFGQKFQSIGFDNDEDTLNSRSYVHLSCDQVKSSDYGYIAKSQDAIELFLQVLLCLCKRLRQNDSNLSNLPEISMNINNENSSNSNNNSSKSPLLSSSGDEHSLTNSKVLLRSASYLQENIEARKVKKVCCGGDHIGVITDLGEVYTWGSNRSGQLGLGEVGSAPMATPTRVTALQGKIVKRISCGVEFTIIITNKLSVFSWGKGTSGQLGHGNKESIPLPKLISALDGKEIVKISCGFHHTAALTEYGQLYMFGEGFIGNGSEGTFPTPLLIDDIEGEEVVCGWEHTVVRTTQGGLFFIHFFTCSLYVFIKYIEVYTWGAGSYGQLGHGNNNDVKQPKLVESLHNKNIKKIGCGYFHTLAITG